MWRRDALITLYSGELAFIHLADDLPKKTQIEYLAASKDGRDSLNGR